MWVILLLYCIPLSVKATCLSEFCKPGFPGLFFFLLPTSCQIYLQLLVPSNTLYIFHLICTEILNTKTSGLHLPELTSQWGFFRVLSRAIGNRKRLGFGVRQPWVQVLALPLISCVTWIKLLDFSGTSVFLSLSGDAAHPQDCYEK